MPPRKSVADKLKKPLQIILFVLFFAGGTLYYFIIGETKAPGFGSDVADYEVAGIEFHFLDVGQGDCSLILCDEYAVLIDGGEYENGEYIVSYLKDHGVEKVDLMVASHRHSDHVGGLTAVLEQMPVSEILINPDGVSEDVDSLAEKQFLSVAQEQNVTMTIAEVDMEYDFADLHLSVLSADAQCAQENESSVVLLAACDRTTALFTGDISEETEESLCTSGKIADCDILKVAHHGSNYSNSDDFIRMVSPEYAVVSCAADNAYGHPGAKTLDRLQNVGATLYRTDQMGTIAITCFAEKTSIYINGKD